VAIALDSAEDLVRFHLGSMVYSCVQPHEPPVQRVLRWHRACAGLGAIIPLFLVHDLGMLFAYPPGEYRIEPFPALPTGVEVGRWRVLLEEAAKLPAVARMRSWGLNDRTVGVVTARVLQEAASRLGGLTDATGLAEGDAALERALPGAVLSAPEILRAWRTGAAPVAEALAEPVLAAIRRGLAQRKLEEVQFVELFGGGDGGLDPQSLVDLVEFAGLSDQLEGVIEDLMCLVPSILSTGRWKNEQYYPIAGISGIASRGSLDSIVPSEYALPREAFYHRYFNGGLTYFGRERPRENQRNLLWLVSNTGFSMAGDPEILTRVLGIALAKKMALKGCEFSYSTFDEALSPVLPLASPADFRYFLTYRSDRPTKERQVLEQLGHTLVRLRQSYDRITVLLITHLHFCDCDDRHSELLEEMKRHARLTGILIGADVEIEKSAASHDRSWKDLSHYLDRRNVLSYSCLRDVRRRREEERRIVLEI